MAEEDMEYVAIDRRYLDGVMRLCEAEGWPSYTSAAEQTWRTLTAPGSCTMVAVESDHVVGFVQLQSDGVVEAHLSLIAVARDRRRRGIGRRLIEEAFARSGAQRIDLVSTEGAEDFYRSFAHRAFPGFRIYPERDRGGAEPSSGGRPTQRQEDRRR
jgi:ribosomal protein S18 acetylase RimI-like enzyme